MPSTSDVASTPAAAHLGSSFCGDAKIEKAAESSEIDAFTKDTPAELAKFEEQGLAELQAFINVAPAAIKPDVQTIYTFTKQLYTALKNANNDFTKLSPSETASLESPAFTKAANAITAYLKTACGISPSPAAT